ncbi:carboxylesterase/lipase family protein [Corynebacterium auriscanis]|uniref:carboxylesterase/lipase family protein n=1 Tax=Corynebacterium auriscanis TaxID=99807 RepID=UPI003CF8BB99
MKFTNRPIVETASGPIAGMVIEGVCTWRGIPYGTAARWEPPRPATWNGVWDGTEYGPVAPQTTYGWGDRVVGDECCLNLDVVRPHSDAQLPVVVYFHGGGFFSGASHTAVLRGFNFSKEIDCVYVGVNFRLGTLGYVDLTSLGWEGTEHWEPNPALSDQIAALRWVHRHIAAFGGDPARVTLMGESAGGAAIAALMSSPASHGLYDRVIMQSAPVMGVHTAVQARVWARKLVQYSGLVPRTATAKELRAVPVADVVRAGQQMLWRGGGLKELNPCFGTSIGGELMPRHPLQQFKEGRQAPTPMLIGTNNDELSVAQLLYFSKGSRADAARRMLQAHDPVGFDEISNAYGDLGKRSNFAHLLTDAVFWAQSVQLAELHSQHDHDVWMYRYDYAPAMLRRLGIGAMHSMELSALFGDTGASKAKLLLGQEQSVLTEQMQEAWGRFIWGDDPGWERYELSNRATRIMERESFTVHDPRADVRRAWQHFRMDGWSGDESSVAMPRPGR